MYLFTSLNPSLVSCILSIGPPLTMSIDRWFGVDSAKSLRNSKSSGLVGYCYLECFLSKFSYLLVLIQLINVDSQMARLGLEFFLPTSKCKIMQFYRDWLHFFSPKNIWGSNPGSQTPQPTLDHCATPWPFGLNAVSSLTSEHRSRLKEVWVHY